MLHTVPAVVAVVLSYPDDFEAAIECAVRLGGDTDTVAAIVGGVVGTRVGCAGLPERWLDGYADWPWTRERLRGVGLALAEGSAPPRVWAWALPKNLVMLVLALWHLAQRISPGALHAR